MNITETYYLKAQDNYPYNIEETIENLNYALSYNGEYAPALCLKGRLYANEIKDYALAEEFFTRALAADIAYSETYLQFVRLLINLERFDEAGNLLDQALTIKGVIKSELYQLKALCFESRADFEKAEKYITKAQECSFNADLDTMLQKEHKRISRKRKKLEKLKENAGKENTRQWVKTYVL